MVKDKKNAGLAVVSNQLAVKPHEIAKVPELKEGKIAFDEIPLILYREISEILGEGEEEQIVEARHNRPFLVRKLSQNHRVTGFAGAIGYSKPYEFGYFVLWEEVPKGNDTIFEPQPILEIAAGPRTTDTWALGSGNLIMEKVTVKLDTFYGVSVLSPAMNLVAMIILRAHQLTQMSTYQKPQQYWEADRWPDKRDYFADEEDD